MNPNTSPQSSALRKRCGSARPAVLALAAIVILVCLAGVYWKLRRPEPLPAADGGTPAERGRPQPAPSAEPAAAPQESATAGPSTSGAPTASPSAVPAPTPSAGAADPALSRLVGGLTALAGTGTMTPELAQAWVTNFSRVVQGGAAAIPALRAFLAEQKDVAFNADTARAVGFRSARLAALDALRQIGGPEAIGLMEQTLTETKSPKEIAVLSWNLNGMTDGQYRAQAVAAARAALNQYATGQTPDMDVAPVFEVFQQYGDASVAADLERAADRWKDYALSTLANLPEQAGVPTLIRLANTVSGGETRLAALQMLAQLAVNNADARSSLVGQMGGGQIPANFWPYLSAPLAGEQLYPVDAILTKYPPVSSWNDVKSIHINYGNQNYYNLPSETVLNVEGINQRLALLDQCLGATTEPAGRQAIQQSMDTLKRRLAQMPTQAVTPGGQ